MSNIDNMGYLNSLRRFGYLPDTLHVRYARSTPAASHDLLLHLAPGRCWSGNVQQDTFGDVWKKYGGRTRLCDCVTERVQATWGNRLDAHTHDQLAWLASTAGRTTLGLRQLPWIQHAWMSRPGPGRNRYVNAAVTELADTLWDAREHIVNSPDYRREFADQVQIEALRYRRMREEATRPEADPPGPDASYGYVIELDIPDGIENVDSSADTVLNQCAEASHTWMLTSATGLLIDRYVAYADPVTDGYARIGDRILVRLPTPVVVSAQWSEVIGLDDGYDVADVLASLPVLASGSTLGDALGALGAART